MFKIHGMPFHIIIRLVISLLVFKVIDKYPVKLIYVLVVFAVSITCKRTELGYNIIHSCT